VRQDRQQTVGFSQTGERRRDGSSGEIEGALVGSLVLNRFLIERRIGSGGFGVVYEAWDGRLERSVAVKAIEQRGEAGRRVLREAQAAARLNHPGIVTLYEMGEEDGNTLLVTELVEGSTLARLAHAGELSDREIAEIGADLCEALDHAHSRGVVHRDIKPQNVQVTEGDCEGESRAKLMDFGIAHLADGAALTAPGDVVGTLAYMAPEQAEGRPAGPEADVYSLALMLYECWSGENPHRRASPAATARAIGARTRPLRRLRPDLPRELSAEIDACLAPRPSHRPSLEQLGTTIEDSLDQLAEQTRPGHTHLAGRIGALALAAVLGTYLAIGHGALLP
jgi:eukaryotic-like serine/threonine-protein kinase